MIIEATTANAMFNTPVLYTANPPSMANLMANTVTITINPKGEKNILLMAIPRSFPE